MTPHKKNQRLRRPCIKCGEYFMPCGISTKICDKCRKKTNYRPDLKKKK